MSQTKAMINSQLLGNHGRLWLQPPPGEQPSKSICVLLDGEYYVERMEAPTLIDELQRSGFVPPIAVAYVSHVDGPTRWKESPCNDQFSRFVTEELISWVLNQFDPPAARIPIILGGLSLTGLADAHAVLRSPQFFKGSCANRRRSGGRISESSNYAEDPARRRYGFVSRAGRGKGPNSLNMVPT